MNKPISVKINLNNATTRLFTHRLWRVIDTDNDFTKNIIYAKTIDILLPFMQKLTEQLKKDIK
jgi:hypothetical protein